MHAIKRLKNRTITLLIVAALAFSLVFGALSFVGRSAYAENVDDRMDIAPSSLGLSNTHFDSSSGSYPASPSSWTGAAIDGGSGSVISGVVDLSASAYSGSNSGNKKFKLDQYKEYEDEKDMPKTIFGPSSKYADSTEKALMINTAKGSYVAYGYSSGEMTFAANAFYRISVWVKTGDFNYAGDQGATVKLTGLGTNCAFNNINTVKNLLKGPDGLPVLNESNNYGWVKYKFYVRSSASRTATVKLVLGLGDAASGTDEDPVVPVAHTHGYAFFDTVEAERISAFDFASETTHLNTPTSNPKMFTDKSGTAIALNLNETQSFTTADGDEIGTFSQNTDLWTKNVYYDENSEDLSYTGTAHAYTYNSEARIRDMDSDANTYGFTKNPWAPFGRAEYSILDKNKFFDGINNADIMMITTYDGKEFGKAAYGIASPTVRIERFGYYRFSVWVKDDKVEGGNGISILVKGKNADVGAQKTTLLTSYTNLTGDSGDENHYGWKEQIVYIRGSMLFDYDVSFELWLGAPSAMSSGIAMFDNVTFTKLKYSDYSEMSSADGGNVYTIDPAGESTGITNGKFNSIGDMEEIKYPLPVTDWTYYTPDTVNAIGFSTREVNTDNAVHGIIPTDKRTYPTIGSEIPGVIYIGSDNDTALLLSSTTLTAFCYQSAQITLSASTAYKLTVDLAVNNIKGYGAALVLKTTDGNVISTIENITSTNNVYKTYTFYIAAPLADQTVNLEIWLGLNDRKFNDTKLASGYVYVKQAALNSWTADTSVDSSNTVVKEFDAKLAEYKNKVQSRAGVMSLDYGIYSFSSPTLDYYDAYTYAMDDGFGQLYQWTFSTNDNAKVKHGMFNASFRKNLEIYKGFDNDGLTGNMLYIYNTDYNRTTYSFNNTLSLSSNLYYRIDVKVKVRLTDEVRSNSDAIGANIILTGANAKFENIKDTSTLVDPTNEDSRLTETFATYTFYVATGDGGGNIGMEISFGGEDKDSYIIGELIVGDITMTAIDNLDFEEAEGKTGAKQIAVRLSDTASTDNTEPVEAGSGEIQWWIIPTVIFGAALLIAIALIFALRIRDHIKAKRKVVYASEYDRNDVMKDIERLQALKDSDKQSTTEEEKKPLYDDDEYYTPSPKTETKEQQEPADLPATTEEEPAAEQPAKEKSPTADDLDD